MSDDLRWPPDVERQLSLLTRQLMFDFPRVSAMVQQYVTMRGYGDSHLYTADACRMHFALLDSRLSDSAAAAETAGFSGAAVPARPAALPERQFAAAYAQPSSSPPRSVPASARPPPPSPPAPLPARATSAPLTLAPAARAAAAAAVEDLIPPSGSGVEGPHAHLTVEQLTALVFDQHAAPSDFSIFTHSLKDRFEEIFAGVRRRLPMTQSDPDEDDSTPLDVVALKSALLAPLAQRMQLVSAADAGRLLNTDAADDDAAVSLAASAVSASASASASAFASASATVAVAVASAGTASGAASRSAAGTSASVLGVRRTMNPRASRSADDSDDAASSDDDTDDGVGSDPVRPARFVPTAAAPSRVRARGAGAMPMAATPSASTLLSMDQLGGIDLDALLHSLERGSAL